MPIRPLSCAYTRRLWHPDQLQLDNVPVHGPVLGLPTWHLCRRLQPSLLPAVLIHLAQQLDLHQELNLPVRKRLLQGGVRRDRLPRGASKRVPLQPR